MHWLTPAEHLEIERAAEFRHEYFNGQMYLLPGGTLQHAVMFAANPDSRIAEPILSSIFR